MAIVTISREYGSGGLKIGELVAKRLGYDIFDNNIINEVAKKAKVSLKSVQEIEKTAGNTFLNLLTSMASGLSFVGHAPGIKSDFDEEKYRTFLDRTIKEIAARGNAVIVGRGGRFILKDDPAPLHIYLLASYEERIRNLMSSYQNDEKKAESVAVKGEQKRVKFLQGFGVEDPQNPHHFHVSINTSIVPENQAVDLICALVKIKEGA